MTKNDLRVLFIAQKDSEWALQIQMLVLLSCYHHRHRQFKHSGFHIFVKSKDEIIRKLEAKRMFLNHYIFQLLQAAIFSVQWCAYSLIQLQCNWACDKIYISRHELNTCYIILILISHFLFELYVYCFRVILCKYMLC